MQMIFFLMTLFLISGCQAMDSNNDANVAADAQGSGSQKVTTIGDDQDALRMGVSVRVSGLAKEQGLAVAKSFEEQLSRFEPCLKAGKTEIAKLVSDWKMGGDGLLTDIEVVSVVPENKIFQDCVVKQLKLLEFKETKGSGQVTLGTYWGRKGDWRPQERDGQKRFEKAR